MNKSAWIVGVLVCAALGADLARAQAQPATGGIFTCVDRQGRRHTADRPIPECMDREQRELGSSGTTTRRQIGPSLSENERAVVEAQRRKEAEEQARIREERRRERALTARYPDKETHDIERAAAIQTVDDVTATAQKRLDELRQDRKALDTEMEFYKRDPNKAPMSLRRKIAEYEESVAEQQRFIAGQDAEKRRVHQRFDVELAQLRKLWESQRLPPAPVAAPAASR